MFALVDGHNFYVSCERVFRPSLNGRPVIVLSNNDGCAIARSDEAKALGVKMGQPWFECKHLERKHGLVALSANFALYGDLSERMMTIAAGYAPHQEVYSIDESFLEFSGVGGDLTERCRTLRKHILRWTGIPCGVGLGPTKTLAKLANHVAKSAARKPGSYPAHFAQVCHLGELGRAELNAVLAATEVGDVWGVGRRHSAKLHAQGDKTALDLAQLSPADVRRGFSVVLEKTVRELQGVACLQMEEMPGPKQQIMCSRSFGRPVTRGADLAAAITEYASRTAEKLRKQQGAAGAVHVFIRTSPFRADEPPYSNAVTVSLVRPTADTSLIAHAAIQGLRSIFRPGFNYAKAGVMLLELQGQEVAQAELDFGPPPVPAPSAAQSSVSSRVSRDPAKLMAALDELNQRFGRSTVSLAGAGAAHPVKTWQMRQERCTPQYTTRWGDMPVVAAG